MESQIVCDYTEVDDNGFLGDALKLDESIQGQLKYMLSLESRELRNQAQKLKRQRTDLMVGELSNRNNPQDFAQFAGASTTG